MWSKNLFLFLLDNDSEGQDYVYEIWWTMVIWIIKPGTLRPVFEAHEAHEADEAILL